MSRFVREGWTNGGFAGNGAHGNGLRTGPAQPDSGMLAGHPGGNGTRRSGHPGPSRPVSVSVIIPALNECRNLPHVLPRIPAWIDEVVLVDGGSQDGTVEVALALRPDIRVVRELRPGKGLALQAGFRESRGDIIVTLDADGSADPAEIPAFVGCLLAGADFAKGSRFAQGGGTRDMELLRRAGNWGLRLLVRIAFGGRYSDLCYGYNAFWRHVLPVIDGDADGFEIETLMNVRSLAAGLRVAEVASHEGARIHGQSHLNTFRDGVRVLRTIARERLRSLRRSPAALEARSRMPEVTLRVAANGHREHQEVPIDGR
jgi:glycosyltransferase involved in cell wall biosynthesis